MTLDGMGRRLNRAIGSDVMGWLTGFRHHYNLWKFPQKWVVGEVEHAVEEGGKEYDSRMWYFSELLPRDDVITWRLAHIEVRSHCRYLHRGKGSDGKKHGARRI